MTVGRRQSNQEKSDLSEKRKLTNTRNYWKWTPSSKKEKIKKNTPVEGENNSKPN